jgi:hypothetical protein
MQPSMHGLCISLFIYDNLSKNILYCKDSSNKNILLKDEKSTFVKQYFILEERLKLFEFVMFKIWILIE